MLVVGDLSHTALLEKTLRELKPDAVVHFASFIQAGESVKEPLKDYYNNSVYAINLLSAMMDLSIRKCIFSSTAAVYGLPKNVPITENEPVISINPYGWSKAFVEKVSEDHSTAKDLRYIALRYFNAAVQTLIRGSVNGTTLKHI